MEAARLAGLSHVYLRRPDARPSRRGGPPPLGPVVASFPERHWYRLRLARRRRSRRCRSLFGALAGVRRIAYRTAVGSCVERLPVPVVVVGQHLHRRHRQDTARHLACRALRARGFRPGHCRPRSRRRERAARARPRSAGDPARSATNRCCCAERSGARCGSAATARPPPARCSPRTPIATSSSATTACSTTPWRATVEIAVIDERGTATAGCCRPGRCASRRRGRSTRRCSTARLPAPARLRCGSSRPASTACAMRDVPPARKRCAAKQRTRSRASAIPGAVFRHAARLGLPSRRTRSPTITCLAPTTSLSPPAMPC